MNKHDNTITEIENVLLDSDLSTYEAIGVLEVVKQLLYKAIEIGNTEKDECKKMNGGKNISKKEEK